MSALNVQGKIITVFGGSGFIGKAVVRALAKAGFRVRVCSRNAMSAYDLKMGGDVGQIQIMRCDVRRDSDVEAALKGALGFVNLIGILTPAPGRGFDQMHRQVSERISKCAATNKIERAVYVSAIGANVKSESTYARTKATAEQALLKALPKASIVRPSVVFGHGDGFFNLLATQMSLLPFMPAFGGGKTRFQPVYVGDVADAIAKILSQTGHEGDIYELGGPKTYSFSELIAYTGEVIKMQRGQIPLPFFAARLIGLGGDLMTLVGLPPLLTNDQVTLLKANNVVAGGALGFKDLGITPTGLESIVPQYLWRYRDGGQFAQTTN
jgi:NADH dehydrogenase